MTRYARLAATGARAAAACCIAITATAAGAAPGPMDFLFTTGNVPAADNSRAEPRALKFDEFSALRLVPREPGAAPNQHPATLNAEPLRAALAAVEFTLPSGRSQALFASAELADLAPALARLLATAKADDDVLLLSTSRREEGMLSTPKSLTARLFVQEGALQLIVNDARADVYSGFRATRVVPALGFGSRASASRIALRSASAAPRRGDWVAIDLRAGAAAPTAAPPPPPAPIAGPAPAATIGTAPATAAPSATPAPPGRARDATFFDEQEQRLRGLKRLREQNLITEEEYEQKRREILKSL